MHNDPMRQTAGPPFGPCRERPARRTTASSKTLVVLVAALLVAAPLAAQHQTVETGGGWARGLAHWGKWATAAAAVTFAGLAVREQERSSEHWDRLLDICRADNASCVVGVDGRYVNAQAESEYQYALRYDGRARTRLIAGQAALLVTVGLFLLDRRPGPNGPDNIPLSPFTLSGDVMTGEARVGVRWAF